MCSLLKSDSDPAAVVLGANLNGLGIMRNLGSRGIHTITIDYRHYMIGLFSRYGEKQICPKNKLLDTLKTIGARYVNKAILFPTGDEFLDLIMKYREDLAHYYHFPFPQNDLLKKILDKGEFYDLIKMLDSDIPKTWSGDNMNNLAQIRFPCILKPALGYKFRNYFFNKKVLVVNELLTLKSLVNYFSTKGLKMIIQEIVPGNDRNQISVATYFDNNSIPLSTFVSRKVRQNPIGFGVGTYVESYREDYLESRAKNLLSNLGYKGIAEVEYKYDEQDRKYKLIEINPRSWEQNELASMMGRDIIYAAYADLAGKVLDQKNTNHEKMTWVFMFRDILSACSYIWHRQLSLKEFIKSYHTKKVWAVFRFNDPLPLLGFFYFSLIVGILSLCSKAQRFARMIIEWLIGLFFKY